uniref:Uncharacterized protein n=1 Tax=Daucus carota subsp. sativus TaxID=79200 RepID=A0A164W2V7_DAUCS
MRGRLRIDGRVFGENPSWLEVPVEFWSKRLPAGSDAPVIPEPILAPGDETPKYGAEDQRIERIEEMREEKTDPNQAGSTANKRKDSKAVVQPPAEASKQPTAANKVQRTAEVVNTTSHGGIFRKFKPPAQSSSRQCLGVEPIPGQKYTSLKNLQDAGKKKQKELLKKN